MQAQVLGSAKSTNSSHMSLLVSGTVVFLSLWGQGRIRGREIRIWAGETAYLILTMTEIASLSDWDSVINHPVLELLALSASSEQMTIQG